MQWYYAFQECSTQRVHYELELLNSRTQRYFSFQDRSTYRVHAQLWAWKIQLKDFMVRCNSLMIRSIISNRIRNSILTTYNLKKLLLSMILNSWSPCRIYGHERFNSEVYITIWTHVYDSYHSLTYFFKTYFKSIVDLKRFTMELKGFLELYS